MHHVLICFGCRVPLAEGSFGVYCCELCQKLQAQRIPGRMQVVPERVHTDDCVRRLREMLTHQRRLLLVGSATP